MNTSNIYEKHHSHSFVFKDKDEVWKKFPDKIQNKEMPIYEHLFHWEICTNDPGIYKLSGVVGFQMIINEMLSAMYEQNPELLDELISSDLGDNPFDEEALDFIIFNVMKEIQTTHATPIIK